MYNSLENTKRIFLQGEEYILISKFSKAREKDLLNLVGCSLAFIGLSAIAIDQKLHENYWDRHVSIDTE
mgnify:CR=1 FL=1